MFYSQLLHRKLALETKSLKHQLHVEISKHKETQKNLQETIEKLKTLECLLDNREKRLYYNGQLPIYNKEKNLGSHSFTNLSDIRYQNYTLTYIFLVVIIIIYQVDKYVVYHILVPPMQLKYLAEIKKVKMARKRTI